METLMATTKDEKLKKIRLLLHKAISLKGGNTKSHDAKKLIDAVVHRIDLITRNKTT